MQLNNFHFGGVGLAIYYFEICIAAHLHELYVILTMQLPFSNVQRKRRISCNTFMLHIKCV